MFTPVLCWCCNYILHRGLHIVYFFSVALVIIICPPSDEGAVDCKLTERQFTFYKSTEGGKNYKLDELIGYYLIYLHYIINPTNPNLQN